MRTRESFLTASSAITPIALAAALAIIAVSASKQQVTDEQLRAPAGCRSECVSAGRLERPKTNFTAEAAPHVESSSGAVHTW